MKPTRPELYILFERGYSLKDLKGLFPESTLYNYHRRWKNARIVANKIMTGGK